MINNFIRTAFLLIAWLLSSCSMGSMQEEATKTAKLKSQPTPNLISSDTTVIWNKFQHNSLARLHSKEMAVTDPIEKAWIKLAIISKQNNANNHNLEQQLITWRTENPTHPGNQLFPDNQILEALSQQKKPTHIALLLPLQGPYALLGKKVQQGFLRAYYDQITNTAEQTVKFYDTSTVLDIKNLYQQATAEGADIIIGPLTKENVQQISQNQMNVPLLALNYTASASFSPNLYQFGLLPEDEITQIIERVHERGLTKALLIAPRNPWGERMASAFRERFKDQGGNIIDSLFYAKSSNLNQEIAALLQIDPLKDAKLMQNTNEKNLLIEQRRQDFDVIFLIAKPKESRIIVPLLHYYYATNIPIFASSIIYSGTPNPIKDADLDGVTICDIPWRVYPRKTDSRDNHPLYAVGEDAYHLSQALYRLQTLRAFPLYSNTGALTLATNNQIHRRMPCLTMQHGLLN